MNDIPSYLTYYICELNNRYQMESLSMYTVVPSVFHDF
jgi:hypothetical protein